MKIYKLNNFGFDLLIDYYQNFDQAGQEGFISEKTIEDILGKNLKDVILPSEILLEIDSMY